LAQARLPGHSARLGQDGVIPRFNDASLCKGASAVRDANSLESLEAFDHGVHRSTESLLTAEITFMSGEVR
jgi:hypothetical protein